MVGDNVGDGSVGDSVGQCVGERLGAIVGHAVVVGCVTTGAEEGNRVAGGRLGALSIGEVGRLVDGLLVTGAAVGMDVVGAWVGR